MHLKPPAGTPQPVGARDREQPVPRRRLGPDPDRRHRGHAQRTAIARLVAEFMRLAGTRPGLACAEGLYVGGRRIAEGDCAQEPRAGC